MKRKVISVIAAAVVGLSLLVGGMLAYFQDVTETKTNTFTTGMVDIELAEPGWDALTDEQRILVPGREIVKDPTVTVKAKSEACYVRVKLEVPAKLAAVLEDLEIGAGWTKVGDYYNYDHTVAKATTDTALPALISKVKVKTDADLSAFAAEDLDIKVTAYAIQAEGFADAATAWAAFAP